MAVSIRITHNLPQIQRLFQSIRQFGGNPTPLLQDMAILGENTTRERFSTKIAPDGSRWIRGLKNGDDTLHQDGHLVESISGYVNDKSAVWGVNRIYAAIHQFGGTIKAKGAGGLRFQIGGRWSNKRQVTIPARPFLGLSDSDRQDMLDLVSDHLNNLIRRSAPGGA
ncbi:MAG: phage virion morphogenesis protein [Pseudomonas sp.]|nr:phage virion morphogenesis protein [Pseudomonas sp.]